MSILNPWGELRELKARLASEEAAYAEEETAQQKELAKLRADNKTLESELGGYKILYASLNEKMKTMHRRDPKTGRILPRGK